VAFDHDEKTVYVAGGRHITRYCLTTGKRLDGWQVGDGLNDILMMRPDGRVWSLRREFRPPDLADIVLRHSVAESVAAGVGAFPWPPGTEMVLRHLVAGGEAKELYRRPRPKGEIHRAHLSPDGREVVIEVTAGGEAQFVRWDVASGEARTVATSVPHGRLTHHPHSRTQTVGLRLFEPGQTEPTVVFDLGNEPQGGTEEQVSADGRWVHWGRQDGTVLVADIDRCLKALEKYPR
jgi:hypothetical protein